MALTTSPAPSNFLQVSENPLFLGNKQVWMGRLSADTSYPTGGYTFDPYLVGIDRLGFIFVAPEMVVGGPAVYYMWNPTTKKLQGFTPAGAEIANATNLSSSRFSAIVVGF